MSPPTPEHVSLPSDTFPKGSGVGGGGQRSAQTCRLLLPAPLRRRNDPRTICRQAGTVASPPPTSARCSGPHWGKGPGNRPRGPVSMLGPTHNTGPAPQTQSQARARPTAFQRERPGGPPSRAAAWTGELHRAPETLHPVRSHHWRAGWQRRWTQSLQVAPREYGIWG